EAVVALWDSIRGAGDKLGVLAAFEVESVVLPAAEGVESGLDLGIEMEVFGEGEKVDGEGWRSFVEGYSTEGWKLVQSDWHHGRFVPVGGGGLPRSEIDFNLHAIHPGTRTAAMVEGLAEVEWAVLPRVVLKRVKVKVKRGGGFFRKLFSAEGKAGEYATAHPVLVYDLDGDGLSEIALPRWNRVYRNRGGGEFREAKLLKKPVGFEESAVFSDFDGDGFVDLLVVGKVGGLLLFRGGRGGYFDGEGEACAEGVEFLGASAMTAGDVDGDGDLDVWVTQYKLAFQDGQMPTPYYNANDGWPSYLLENDGSGRFRDVTEERGLERLRKRRTFAASLVDYDADGDLDLVNVADYAGVEFHENDGGGGFREVTGEVVEQWQTFGMGHAVSDFDGDGRMDLYVTGMSSTTARRLDRLGLGRGDRPDVHKMRGVMGFGNRMYFGAGGRFREDEVVDAAVARTGWSWGVVAEDFDLDGDRDLYVANGFRSGKSTQDYCTTFWRHDIYSAGSEDNPLIEGLFADSLAPVNAGDVSWNGFEKNHLLMNVAGLEGRFEDVAFLVGAGLSFDARVVVADDLDGDGRMDLVMTESWWDGKGVVTALHVYRNELVLPAGRGWTGLRLREKGGGRSPNGAVVELVLKSGKRMREWVVTGDSFAAQQAPAAHFGVPAGEAVERFEVKWSNGEVEKVEARLGVWVRIGENAEKLTF
ncbi:MAG: CRTAC1 family protein, partial [Verrucomicrobiales bacterium]|nr:CRTAC1 family protein [Verrucomicrobiales bacterium]